jgi:hypothetical protein
MGRAFVFETSRNGDLKDLEVKPHMAINTVKTINSSSSVRRRPAEGDNFQCLHIVSRCQVIRAWLKSIQRTEKA